jgi:DNA-binding GntR family transcriptional regulator
MEKLVDQHEEALHNRNVTRASDINAAFHNLIIDRCGNPRLVQILNNLDDHLKRYRLLSISQGARADKSVPEHRAILQALRSHDSDQAEQAMRDHLQSAMRDLYDQDFAELEKNLHNQKR